MRNDFYSNFIQKVFEKVTLKKKKIYRQQNSMQNNHAC